MIRIVAIASLISLLTGAGGAWYFRGVLCDRAMLREHQAVAEATQAAMQKRLDALAAQRDAMDQTLTQRQQERDTARDQADQLRAALSEARKNDEGYRSCSSRPLPAAVRERMRNALRSVSGE